jgi:hypothetical protein
VKRFKRSEFGPIIRQRLPLRLEERFSCAGSYSMIQARYFETKEPGMATLIGVIVFGLAGAFIVVAKFVQARESVRSITRRSLRRAKPEPPLPAPPSPSE